MYARVLVAVAIAATGLSLAGCARIESSLEPEPIVVTQEATAARAGVRPVAAR